MNSLEKALQLGLIASLAVMMFIFWWTVTLTGRMLTESHVFTDLQRQTEALHSSIVKQETDEAAMQAILDAEPDRLLVIMQGDQVLQSVSNIDALAPGFRQLVAGQSLRVNVDGANGQPILGWFGGFAFEGELRVLGVLKDVSAITEKLRVFDGFSAVLALATLAVVLTVQHLILRRSVEKLEGIRRDMLRLEQGQAVALSEDVPLEITPLVSEFNQLLRRFEQRLRQSRNAVGNLAHSLKGPLNLLIRSTEGDVIDESQRHAIAQNALHIRRLIESELKRARLAGRGTVGIRFDIDAELPAMIGLLEQVYSEKQIDVRYEVEASVELLHDRQDMLELIGNLLDNAVKWSQSVVLLNIRSSDGVLIDVEDDGPGCSPEVLGQLTGRGVRVDESVAGHGLGLSIVKDIVDSYDGRLVLEKSGDLGGLKVSVYLPGRKR